MNNSQTNRNPARHTNQDGDSLDQLLKLDPASSLPGYSDGLQAAYAYAPDEWREQGLALARYLAGTGEPFTVADLQRLGLPEPEKPEQWGALVAAMRNRKIAEHIGWTEHTTAKGKKHGVRIWQGTGK